MRSAIIFLTALVLLTGCEPSVDVKKETDERAYRRGKSLLKEGRKDEALEAFLSVIASRDNAAESHLEAGLLYLHHLEDPLAAIHHFRQYLAIKPDAEFSDFVKDLIMTAKKDFAKSLPGEPFAEEVNRVKLLDTVERLNNENLELRKTVVSLKSDIEKYRDHIGELETALEEAKASGENVRDVSPIVIESNQESGEQDHPDRYTVESGDTLSKISRKMYGTTGRWMDIFQANRDQLPSPNALSPGQELRIP